ncbi:hypothetical protein JTB14_037910 [Gonioctena quinquepunctata]|nr:hypothetical protein JTB14_037910 [Gonioctena quinquepunctata]
MYGGGEFGLLFLAYGIMMENINTIIFVRGFHGKKIYFSDSVEYLSRHQSRNMENNVLEREQPVLVRKSDKTVNGPNVIWNAAIDSLVGILDSRGHLHHSCMKQHR